MLSLQWGHKGLAVPCIQFLANNLSKFSEFRDQYLKNTQNCSLEKVIIMELIIYGVLLYRSSFSETEIRVV